MAQTSPPSITGSPTAPQRGDRTTFSARVDAFVTWMATAVGEFGAVASNVYGNAVDAYNNAVAGAASAAAASNSEANAAASAIASASSAGALMWVSGTTYALGAAVWSPANRIVYRKITASSVSSTDPSADSTNWAMIGSIGLTLLNVTGTTQAAVAGTHYYLTNVALTTLTLPASPSAGDMVAVTVANSLTTNVIARNAQTIMGVAEDMTIDNALATVTLRFISNSWRII